MPIPRNVQKEIPPNVTSWSVFDADFDLDIRVENVKKKRKRIEKKIRRKKMEGRGERNKKNISKNCPNGGWNELCSPTCSFGMNNVASGTSG